MGKFRLLLLAMFVVGATACSWENAVYAEQDSAAVKQAGADAAQASGQSILVSEDQKTLYALGQLMSRSLSSFNLTPAEFEIVRQGLTDAGTGKKPAVEINAYTEKIHELFIARRKAEGKKAAVMNKDFLDKAARQKGAVKTGSGTVYLSLRDGGGASPNPTDTVKVNYSGTFPDGREFGGTSKRGEPVEMKMDNALKCWKEGLSKMKSGGKARLVCPPETAYGETGQGDLILPYATLVFEVELLEVKK